MLVQDVMQSPVHTTDASAAIADAYRIMHERSFRHLPVLDAGTLVGVVTDRDLRLATSQLNEMPVDASEPVRTVMSANPITAGLLDPVEEAARLLRRERIGCLPVLDGPDLVGIVTVTNLLDAVIRLTGLEKPGSRLAVSLPDTPGQLARLTQRVAASGLDIRSVLTYAEATLTDEGPEGTPEAPSSNLDSNPDSETSDPDPSDADSVPRLRVILRVGSLSIRPLAQTLRDEGFDVIWPQPKPV